MSIKIFGDAISGLQKILYINKIECTKNLEISIDTFENWENGRNKPCAGNSEVKSEGPKKVSIKSISEKVESQYQKRLEKGMLDRELLEGFLDCLTLPDASKAYLSEYIMKPEFAQRLLECAYEYHNLLQNKNEILWKKVIEVHSNNWLEVNKKKLKLKIGSRSINVITDLEISLKKLVEGLIDELFRRDLLENELNYKKHYSFQVRDKSKKMHIIKADEYKYLKDIEDINYESIEIVERIGETTIMITTNMEFEEVVYPFMERILEDNTADPETNAERFKIFKDYFIIGRRSEDSDYVIPSKFIGNTHALINLENGRYFITDLDSKNGTYLNGKRLKPSERCEIFNNDIIGFVKFKYLLIIPEV